MFFSCGVHCKLKSLMFYNFWLERFLLRLVCSTDENFWFWPVLVELWFWILFVVLKQYQYAFWFVLGFHVLIFSVYLALSLYSRWHQGFLQLWTRMKVWDVAVFIYSLPFNFFVAFLYLKRWPFAVMITSSLYFCSSTDEYSRFWPVPRWVWFWVLFVVYLYDAYTIRFGL